MRVVHYQNQFFGGIGGEDVADTPLTVREGPVGPGILLQKLLGDEGQIVATLICGDNVAASRGATVLADGVRLAMEEHGADVLVAGPAFQSGRYGISCAAAVEAAWNADLPAVVAMHPDNPGVGLCPGLVPVVIAGENAADMVPTLQRVAPIALRIGAGGRLDAAARRDCIRRNIRRNIFAPEPAAVRAVDMMLTRLRGGAYESEIVPPPFPAIAPAPPVEPGRAKISLITTGGVVPRGNPDRLESSAATKWLSYSVSGRPALSAEEFECIHAGINSAHLSNDPNRLVPLDVCRELESETLIGSLASTYQVTVGNLTPVAVAEQFGIEMARALKRSGAEAAILSST